MVDFLTAMEKGTKITPNLYDGMKDMQVLEAGHPVVGDRPARSPSPKSSERWLRLAKVRVDPLEEGWGLVKSPSLVLPAADPEPTSKGLGDRMKAKIVPIYFKTPEDPEFAAQLAEAHELLAEDAEFLAPVQLGGRRARRPTP